MRWADIERLLDSIGKHLPSSSVSVSCTDGLLRVFDDIEELKAFNNAERTAVTTLRIFSRGRNAGECFKISLSNGEGRNVKVELDAVDEQTAATIYRIYQDFLDALKPWYSRIAKTQVGFLISCFVLIVFAAPIAIELFKASLVSNSWSGNIDSRKFALVALGILMPMIFNSNLNGLRDKYFPMGTFAFGDGETRHQKNEVVRQVIILGSVISVVTSVVLSRVL